MKLKPVVASLVMIGLMSPVFAEKATTMAQQAGVNQNSVISPVCSEGWFNRISVGGVGNIVGIIGNRSPAGTFSSTEQNGTDLFVNNANLLVNAKLSSWSTATANLAYLGAPILKDRIRDNVTEERVINHSFIADEYYVTLGDLAKYPFYVKVGKSYVPFGDYADPYTPYQIMSPTQMLSQVNAVNAVAGLSTKFGLYGSIFGFRGDHHPVGSKVGTIRNFGAKIGYYNDLASFNAPGTHVNFNVGYLYNLWDTQMFTGNIMPQWFTVENSIDRDPIGGIAAHADITYKAFGLSANVVSAVKKMVTDAESAKADNSRFWAADVNATYSFKTLSRESMLGAGIQWTGNGEWFGDSKTTFCKIIPKWRLLGEYKINIFDHTDLGLVVAHGKSYDFVTGTDTNPAGQRNTTVGLARLMVQL